MQSPSVAHDVRHAVAPHTYAPQLCVVAAGQCPAPSQDAANVSTPPAQAAARQLVAADGYTHAADAPLHVPPHVPDPVHAVRPPTGAPLTNEHVPTAPGRLHAWHWPLHALLQHTPSTQLPATHWLAPAQVEPSASFGAHAPLAQ